MKSQRFKRSFVLSRHGRCWSTSLLVYWVLRRRGELMETLPSLDTTPRTQRNPSLVPLSPDPTITTVYRPSFYLLYNLLISFSQFVASCWYRWLFIIKLAVFFRTHVSKKTCKDNCSVSKCVTLCFKLNWISTIFNY